MAMSTGPTAPGGELEPLMEINTTPLIDVMLVLLIMLIITIPAQLHTVNLDMPQASKSTVKVEPVIVRAEVNADSVVLWNGQAVASRTELDGLLKQAAAAQPQPELHIRSHPKARYEVAAGVLAAAQRNGLRKLGIVGTEQFIR